MTAFIGIVEDNKEQVTILKRKFQEQAIVATSFEEFIDKLAKNKNIKIWFLDVEIPKKEGEIPHKEVGFEIAKIIMKESPNTPRYCISGSHFDSTLYKEALQKGRLSVMQAKVEEVLNPK